jgi:hypothetical protein
MTTQNVVPASATSRWNTLQILIAVRIALILSTVLLLFAVLAGVAVHRGAMKTVGKDSAPSIIAAQHIKSALADMDADAINELLSPASAEAANFRAYESRRIEAAAALVSAAENITYGNSERAPIRTLQIGLGTYERLIQKARDLHASGSPNFLAAYRDAGAMMDGTLLPAADALDQANNSVLEESYESQSAKSFFARAAILTLGLLSLAAFAWSQIFLTARTRRTLNPLLLAATLLTLLLAGYTFVAMSREQSQLRIAKEDAFTSIHALWRARAVAYQANADESRYLLDPANAAADEQAFSNRAALLVTVPAGMTIDQIVAAAAAGHHVYGFNGYLAEELNNITFRGEREAANQALQSFARYLAIDAQLRALEQHGQHQQAIDLCLGTMPGESDWAFAQFDQAVDRTLTINQRAFDDAVQSGFSGLAGLELQACILAGIIATLTFVGLAPRLREYQ